jgi:hypothetical protein
MPVDRLEERLARAISHPGSVVERLPNELLDQWMTRAVRAVLNGEDGPLGMIRKLHQPWGIYTECGHEHTDPDEDGVHEVDLVGLTCDEGLMYRVCQFCCVEPGHAEGFQTEQCATRHVHTTDGPVCPTVAIVDDAQMPEADRWT